MTSTENKITMLSMVEAALKSTRPDPKRPIGSVFFPMADLGRRGQLSIALRSMSQLERMGFFVRLARSWKRASPYDKTEIVACLGDSVSDCIGLPLEAEIHPGTRHHHEHFLYIWVDTTRTSMNVRDSGTQRSLLISARSKDLDMIEELYEATTI